MKKYVTIPLLAVLVLLCGCHPSYSTVLNSFPDYVESESYGEWESREFMIYSKYYFEEDDLSAIESNKYLEKITEENFEYVEGYFRYYVSRLRDNPYQSDIKHDYDFVYATDIQLGDYYYVYTREGEEYGNGSVMGRYDYFYLYYFDVESLTLYFIRSDI